MPTYLVFDIETIPDLTVWTPPPVEVVEVPTDPPADAAAPTEKPKRSRKKKAPAGPPKEPEEPFAPLYAHRTIAIGFVWLDENLGVKSFGCIGTSNYGDNERGLLGTFFDFLTRERPLIISWNGRSFDLPVLSMRGYRWGLSQPWYDKETRYRYGDAHLDLYDVMTEYGAVQKKGFGLDMAGKLIGLPPKDVHGAQVTALFAQGAIDTIETHCLKDVISTAFVFLRYRLLRGYLTTEFYNAAVMNLVNACRATQRLETFVAGIDATRLLITP